MLLFVPQNSVIGKHFIKIKDHFISYLHSIVTFVMPVSLLKKVERTH